MPNWVHSGFNVTGPEAEIKRFERLVFRSVPRRDAFGSIQEGAAEVVFDFDAIIPMPADTSPDGPERWAAEHWGMKWTAQDLMLTPRHDEGELHFQFSTAWDFPEPVFRALATAFPNLVFSGSAFEENHEFELLGQFNGDDDWGPGEIEWIVFDDPEEEGEEEAER